jgi:hypothetical protein
LILSRYQILLELLKRQQSLGKVKRDNKAREEGEKGEWNSSRIEKTTMEWIKATGPTNRTFTKKLPIENKFLDHWFIYILQTLGIKRQNIRILSPKGPAKVENTHIFRAENCILAFK